MVATIEYSFKKLHSLTMPLKFSNISTSLLVDSVSACSFFKQVARTRVIKGNSHVIWVSEMNKH